MILYCVVVVGGGRGKTGRKDVNAVFPPLVWVDSTCPLLRLHNTSLEVQVFFNYYYYFAH